MSNRYTLLLRLEAVLQAWGGRSHFNDRDTLARPTKCGVIGLLAAADGHDRNDQPADDGHTYLPLATLAALRFAVRADRPGTFLHDFQTAGGGRFPVRPRDLITDPKRAQKAAPANDTVPGRVFSPAATSRLTDWYGAPKNITPDPDSGALTAGNTGRHPVIRNRWYLADAAFLAAVESPDRALLARLAERLDAPRRLLWLGRKNCPPTQPLNHGLHYGPLEDALAATPLLPRPARPTCTAWIECAPTDTGAVLMHDQPLSFASDHRSYAPRWEIQTTLTPPGAPR
ncbi:type I-E CRISPR-associated protein Cas5/CasD [Streptomyces noboritoensis]|uniref:Type I-E CRISPR-associated protein Cas5/CasD n=1 Tax=Streptomyces noboritoensis TaxID=67337 RepID=A0ABV6TCJ9_9ACTN